jgi:hypothetical protein
MKNFSGGLWMNKLSAEKQFNWSLHEKPSSLVNSTSTSSMLVKICSVFCLSMDKVTAIFDVPEDVILNWLDGKAAPKGVIRRRVVDLFIISRDLRSSGFLISEKDLETEIVQGRSLYDFLCAKELDRELIMFSGSRLMLHNLGYDILKDPFL